MSILDNAPTNCPYCNSKLQLDIDPCTKNGIEGAELSLYCEGCNNDYWLDLGFEANSDDYDDFVNDYNDSDTDFDNEEDNNSDFDDYEDEFDISLMYPNDTEEDAYDDAYDYFINH